MSVDRRPRRLPRSAILTVVAATAVATLGISLPARAQPLAAEPVRGPDALPAATPAELAPAEPAPEPASDGLDTVAAIVVGEDGAEVVSVDAAVDEVDDVMTDLSRRPDVVDVFVDSPVGVLATDTYRGDQWDIDALHLDDLPPGTPDGAGIVVAVLDTGVRSSHPDLQGRVDCTLGADFTVDVTTSTGNGCTDPHGHGTHVAGTIAAVSDNGIGVEGVSAATIMPVRVLGPNGWGSSASIVAGIYWAVDHGAKIINLSVGGDAAGDFDTAVQYAVDHDVVVVAAAGNNRAQGNTPQYPGATPGAIAVAATDVLGLSSEFSYSGPTNWIAAPGSYITSTTIDGNGYGAMSGTSMSTPHVTGVLARYRDRDPAASVADIRAALASTAIDLEQAGKDDNTGYGLIDAYELLTGDEPLLPADRRTPPAAPVLTSVTAGPGAVTARWRAPGWNGGAPVSAYGVDVWSDDGTSLWYEKSVLVPAGTTVATVAGLVNGATYAVSVYGVNALGEGQWSVFSSSVRPVGPPDAPRIGTPNAGPGAARVRWSAPANNGGSEVTGYTVKVYRGWTLVKTVHTSAAARDVRIGGLRNGVAHSFLVQATNTSGTSLHSARSIKVTPRARPSAPRIGRPTARNDAARVWWAVPSDRGGYAISAYVIKVYQGKRGIKRVTVSGRLTNAMVSGLRNHASYTFTVTAKNALGYGSPSPRSPVVRTR